MALFNIYRTLNMPTEAVAVFQPVVEQNPDNAFFHVSLGQVLRARRYPEAARELRHVLVHEPTLVDSPQNRGWINAYVKLLAASPDAGVRDGQEALRRAREITRGVDYDQWSLIDSLAAAYAETGQFDAATAEMQKVLERRPPAETRKLCR